MTSKRCESPCRVHRARRRCARRVAVLAQALDEVFGGLQVVFDQEQTHGVGSGQAWLVEITGTAARGRRGYAGIVARHRCPRTSLRTYRYRSRAISLTDPDRHEDLRVFALDQQRDDFATLLRGGLQILQRFHRLAVHAQDDVAGLDAGLRPPARRRLRPRRCLRSPLGAFLRARAGARPVPACWRSRLRHRRTRRDALAFLRNLFRARREALRAAIAPHFDRRPSLPGFVFDDESRHLRGRFDLACRRPSG